MKKDNILVYFLSRFFGNFTFLKHQCHVTEIETDKELHEAFPSSAFCKKRNYLFSPDLPMSHSFRGALFFLSRFRLRWVPRTSCAQQKERSPTWAKQIPIHGRGNVPVARTPNPKHHKTPKSIHPQKQHNTAIKFLLFLGSLP